jgi:hypothetical protein
MKFAMIAMMTLSFASIAQAKAVNCMFGESTGDLRDQLKSEGKGKALYEVEHLSLHRKVRINGLTETEKKMVLIAMAQTAQGNQGTELELLEAFSKADGYITYFQHNRSEGGEFAAVASFPGDNEFGVIFQIEELHRKQEYTILRTAAEIEDGDIANCQVEYQKP